MNLERYSRQILFTGIGREGQMKLAQSRAVIIAFDHGLLREVRRLVGGMAYSLNRNHACFSRCDGFSAAGWRRGLR